MPGRVIVPPRALHGPAPETPAERQFLRITTINAVGMGLTPFFSVYAMAVLGLSAGFTMTMSAVSLVAMIVAAAIGGSLISRGSSARHLRFSYAARATAMSLPILALPGSALAPWLMYATAVLGAIGFATGQLAANERMFRLVRGPTVIRQHGRMLFRTSAAMTTGQVVSGVVLAVAPVGYAPFAILFGASAAFRAWAFRAARSETATSAAAAPPADVTLPSGASDVLKRVEAPAG
jgi:hypothetical protein